MSDPHCSAFAFLSLFCPKGFTVVRQLGSARSLQHAGAPFSPLVPVTFLLFGRRKSGAANGETDPSVANNKTLMETQRGRATPLWRARVVG